MPSQPNAHFKRRDLLVSAGFAATNALAHLIWSPISAYGFFVATTMFFVGGLAFVLVKEWSRLEMFVTKFYCVAAVFDLFAEGLLQPFHHYTYANIVCTASMFGVFLVYWLVLHPIERRILLGN